jgi:ParB family transcriptional regulator, chromosome partitioning protein
VAKADLDAAMRTKRRSHVAEAAAEIISSINAPYPGDRVVELELEKIAASPFQVRAMADEDYIDLLAESIRESGMVSPVVVRPLESKASVGEAPSLDSKPYELVAGHHRVEACRKLGLGTVRALIRVLADSEAALALTADNAVRKALTDYERYKHIEMLQACGVCKTQASIARALGVSETLVSFLKSFGSLPAEARRVLDEKPDAVGSTYAAQLKQFADSQPELVVRAVELIVAGKLKASAAQLWIANQIAKPARSYSKTIRIQNRFGVDVKLQVKEGVVTVIAPGIQADRLERLISDNLESLLAP